MSSKQNNETEFIEYKNGQINSAGIKIIDDNISENEKNESLKIIEYWRELHSHPMHVIYMRLRRLVEDDNKKIKGEKYKSIVSARSKRLPSIKKKILKKTKLARMQDLGGCRVVVSTINKVYKYSNEYKKHFHNDEIIKTDNYIDQPKETTGYRSLHLIVKFKSGKIDKYKNKLIEIQFRTHLQHIWATAVETMGICVGSDIKAGNGDDDLKRFFIIISSLFALEEKQPVVPGTSNNKKELTDELYKINKKNDFLNKLNRISKTINLINKNKKNYKTNKNLYHILIFNLEKITLSYFSFKEKEEEKANKIYKIIENNIKNNTKMDTVLVKGKSITDIKKAFPNYFLDINEFIKKVNKYLESY